ncbi:hypothetical protein C3747_127g14 [Trypanosoma cruzi]|uniref:Uncharacterized protein n=2 Tax=Trypanosoma cruzi TaxID=5693 RepID=Q4D402_TRYCC|nr:hypothetical protein, conserved [Trypanosoma cruzi]EAN87248.1 hypothetical protein, conserved [Trypanosoma cruzi]PWV05605.1 hypothetical protein C3747_127g14 [Trypanosoma cruzi]RNC40847.1 hypothetical protein TcCL_NonESM09638 [Trypanosoma cruzi]|eukprot:XP_809099.1 hypothetical protein [Trypanosoma cruzi strain CL Brener]
MATVDRTPSTKSLTDLPKDADSAVSSLLDDDDDDARTRISPDGQVAPRGSRRSTAASPASSGAAQDVFRCPSEAVVSLEQHYLTTVQQLEKIKRMYHRLDTHNDDLEDSFVVLRDRLDAFRSFVVVRLSRTAKELRGEVRFLRDTVLFLMEDFAENLRRCGRHIISRVKHAGGASEPPSLPLGPFHLVPASDVHHNHPNSFCVHGNVNTMNTDPEKRKQSGLLSREALVRSPRSPRSAFPATPGSMAELRGALDKALRKQEHLEDKFIRQQQSYEKHIQSIKDLHAQKERTLRRRIELLERFVRRDVSGENFTDDSTRRDGDDDEFHEAGSNGRSPHSSKLFRRDLFANKNHGVDPRLSTSNALNCTSRRSRLSIERTPPGEADALGEELCSKREGEKSGGWGAPSSVYAMAAGEHASTASDGNGVSRRAHRSPRNEGRPRQRFSAPGEAAAAMEPWTLGHDVERRVRSQMLSGGRKTPYEGRCCRHFSPTSRREEKELEAAAARLLDVVSDAYTAQNDQHQRQREHPRVKSGVCEDDVVSRLYYLRRPPPRRPGTKTYLSPVPRSGSVPRPEKFSDVSTVARGLWAEKLLQQRATQRLS